VAKWNMHVGTGQPAAVQHGKQGLRIFHARRGVALSQLGVVLRQGPRASNNRGVGTTRYGFARLASASEHPRRPSTSPLRCGLTQSTAMLLQMIAREKSRRTPYSSWCTEWELVRATFVGNDHGSTS
jgi:hypothetical protein